MQIKILRWLIWNLCLWARQREVDQETETASMYESTCTCSSWACVCGCVHVCWCVSLSASQSPAVELRTLATHTAVCLAEFPLLLSAKAISTELWQMMGFSNQCHSVYKAFKLCFQSQRLWPSNRSTNTIDCWQQHKPIKKRFCVRTFKSFILAFLKYNMKCGWKNPSAICVVEVLIHYLFHCHMG